MKTNRIAFCSTSAMGLNMHEQPPSITVSFLASIRATAEALEHVSPTVDNLPALEHEVQEHARAQDVDFWTAAAAVTGEPGFTRHAPPPDAPGLDETVRDALRLARERDVDFIDGAQLAMYEHQLADVGVGSDHWRGLRDVRERFLERAQEAAAERRREALCSKLRQRGRMTFDGPADKYVDELADSAPKGDQVGGG